LRKCGKVYSLKTIKVKNADGNKEEKRYVYREDNKCEDFSKRLEEFYGMIYAVGNCK
jgi:hypothetical protein